MKHSVKSGLFVFVLLLMGCNEVEPKTPIDTKEKVLANSFETKEDLLSLLPSLTFTVGETEIRTSNAISSWTYLDRSTGKLVDIEAELLPPYEIVDINAAIPFDLKQSIRLDFEQPPINYELRIWDDKTNVSTNSSFEEIKERGKYILEIAGYWEEGIGIYMAALDFYK